MNAFRDFMNYSGLSKIYSFATGNYVDMTTSFSNQFLKEIDPSKKGYITCGDLKKFFMKHAKNNSRSDTVKRNFKYLKLLELLKDYDTRQIDARSFTARLLLQRVTLTLFTPYTVDLFLNFGAPSENSGLFASEHASCGYQLPLSPGEKKRVIVLKRKGSKSLCLSVLIKS